MSLVPDSCFPSPRLRATLGSLGARPAGADLTVGSDTCCKEPSIASLAGDAVGFSRSGAIFELFLGADFFAVMLVSDLGGVSFLGRGGWFEFGSSKVVIEEVSLIFVSLTVEAFSAMELLPSISGSVVVAESWSLDIPGAPWDSEIACAVLSVISLPPSATIVLVSDSMEV